MDFKFPKIKKIKSFGLDSSITKNNESDSLQQVDVRVLTANTSSTTFLSQNMKANLENPFMRQNGDVWVFPDVGTYKVTVQLESSAGSTIRMKTESDVGIAYRQADDNGCTLQQFVNISNFEKQGVKIQITGSTHYGIDTTYGIKTNVIFEKVGV